MSFKIFGIEADADGVKIAVVEKRLRGHEVTRLTRRAVASADDADIATALREALATAGFNPETDVTAAVFPAIMLSSRALTVPLTSRRQIVETLPFELESATPFDADDFVCDFIPLETTEKETRLLAALALKTEVDRFLAIYDAAGINPDYIIPSPVALARADMAGARSSIIAEIGLTLTLTLIANGLPIAFHAAPLANNTREIAREITRFSLMNGAEPEMAHLAGHAEQAAELESSLKIPVKKARITGDDAPADYGSPSMTSQRPPVFVAAIGAATAVANSGAGPFMNLRTGAYEKQTQFAQNRSRHILTASLAAVALVTLIISYAASGYILSSEYEQLKKLSRAEFRRALPDVTNIVAETQQLQNALDAMTKKQNALPALAMDKDPALSRLLDITNSAPDDAKLDVDEYTYDAEKIIVSGRVTSFEKAERMKSNIESRPWVEKATVEGTKTAVTQNSVSFRMEITQKSPAKPVKKPSAKKVKNETDKL